MDSREKRGGRVRVAVATLDGDTIAPGHFAHSTHFLVFDIEGGRVSPVEVRENPLGYVPDSDAHGHLHGHHGHEGQEDLGGGVVPYLHRYYHMHGVEKYRTLRSEVLHDIDLVVAGGACRTSVEHFTSEGVKMVFADPGEPVAELVGFISTLDLDKIPKISRISKSDQ